MSTTPQVVTVQIGGNTDRFGTQLYMSTQGYISQSTDTPANTVFLPRITGRISYNRKITCVAWGRGNSDASIGYIDFDNTDGALDYWFSIGFRDREVTIKRGLATQAYADFDLIAKAIVERISSPDWHVIRLSLRDKGALMDVPLQTSMYPAITLAPGLEGTPKPVCFGDCFGVPLTMVNSGLLNYDINDGPFVTIDEVTDRGVVLTEGNQWRESPTAGVYGVRRLTNPAGKQVCQVRGTGTGSIVTESLTDVLEFLIGRTDIDIADINPYSVDALQTATGYSLAYWGRDSATVASVTSMVMDSYCGWWYFDRLGELRVDRLKEPVATPVVELSDINLMGDIKIILDEAKGLSDGIGARRNWSPHSENEIADSLLAGSSDLLAAAQRLREPFTVLRGANTLHLTYSASAGAAPIPTLLSNATDGQTEADRLTELYEVERYFYNVSAALEGSLSYELEPGDTVLLTSDRFGLSEGKIMLVVGVNTNLLSSVVDLTLWGPGPSYGDF